MEDGKKFIIEAEGNSKNAVYIQNATLNGKPHTKNYLTYKEIVNGGVFHLKMSDSPNISRGTNVTDRPYSVSIANK